MNYWSRKEQLSKKAKAHAEHMEEVYAQDITTCVNETETFDENVAWISGPKQYTEIQLVDMTSVEAIKAFTPRHAPKHRTCVLNFASHKNPGGKFLEGSSAQEESLCHDSILYNVLSKMPAYYAVNKAFLNRSLYSNRALYSPKILFPIEGSEWRADVLTCAAPNKTAAQKYCKVSDEENTRWLRSRIDFVLGIAASNKPDVLILGAYGCGVFGQDPTEVASIFNEFLSNKYFGEFKKVVFAIPDKTGVNYQAFQSIFPSI
jgi:uncharacterized protein (TIGR02452 family)